MSKDLYKEQLGALSLGKSVDYPNSYTPALLEAVPRSLNRIPLGIDKCLPFQGEDLWNAYEFSWLNTKGKPIVALLECSVPVTSPNIIESKSFKLYLNSFNEHRFESESKIKALLREDLSKTAGAKVSVKIHSLETRAFIISNFDGQCIDQLDIEVRHYEPNAELLQINNNNIVEKSLCSHLLKSNCLITNQPDWGSIFIRYKGPEIIQSSLLEYIISFRKHNEFHEQCVERIYCDILEHCKPEKLSVLARYTRRGGLDINPFRSNFEPSGGNFRLIRQ